MKRFLIIVVTLLIPIGVFPQSLSAYGVKLGEDKYKVKNTLENKGKSIKYSTNKLGEALLTISSPSVGGVTFDDGIFRFNDDNKLRTISFASFDGGLGDPGKPWEAKFHRKAEECKNAFIKMTQNLKLKYGTPDAYSNTSAMWQKGKERISLEYEYKYEYNQFSWIDYFVQLILKYELIDLDNVDY